MRVAEVMQPLENTAAVDGGATVKDALNVITHHKTGAVFVTEGERLVGVFTDGDLRRHIEDDNLLSQPIREVMTPGGHNISVDALATAAVHVVQEHRIGELPVINANNTLLGHVSLKDLISLNFV